MDFDTNVLSRVGSARVSIVNSTFASSNTRGIGPNTSIVADTSDGSNTTATVSAGVHIQDSLFLDQGTSSNMPRFLLEGSAAVAEVFSSEALFEGCEVAEDCSECRLEGSTCTQQEAGTLKGGPGTADFITMGDQWIIAVQQVCFFILHPPTPLHDRFLSL